MRGDRMPMQCENEFNDVLRTNMAPTPQAAAPSERIFLSPAMEW
jgi:hypothetical protein